MSRKKRRLGNRKENPDLVLIVCEGEKTEPYYFESFPVSTLRVVIAGTGYNTLSLIRKTNAELEKAIKNYYNDFGIELKENEVEVWCVFDRDSFDASDFDNAIRSARSRDYKVAYSNEAFELWYLLHFHFFNSAMSRNQYKDKLSKELKTEYKKNDKNMYRILKLHQKTAIENAKRLLTLYDPPRPSQDNPSTTVFQLVEYLNQFILKN